MSGYKGHIVGGVALGATYVGALSAAPSTVLAETGGLMSQWQFVAGLLVLSMLFALWPDIDTNSRGQDIFFGAAFILDILMITQGYIEAAAYFGLLAMTPILGKHRGWTHSKVAMVLVPLPIIVVPYLYKHTLLDTSILLYGAAVTGYFSHLLLDGRIFRWFRVKGSRYSED
jgi:membrane-bound metal-dependent hydrolase YbcI (DUF457 family)